MTALKTRRPTGRVPWPLILIEGGEKSGKSYACALLSTSKRIGTMYWIDLGEGAADEYGAIPGADYLVVEHDGTWAQIQAAVDAVKAEAQAAQVAGLPPVTLVIDSMTAEWDLLKDWAADRARQRHAAKVRNSNGRVKPLAADEEPKISMDLWNEAGARHRKLMTTLMTFPGIVLLTARGKDVAALDDKGSPIPNAREYKVEGHKTLGYDVSCWIRLDRTQPGSVIGVRSVHVGVRPGYDDPVALAADWSLESIIFDTLRCEETAEPRRMTELQAHEPDGALAPLELGVETAADVEQLRKVHAAMVAAHDRGEISDDDRRRLTEMLKARRADLEQQTPPAAEPAEQKTPANDPNRRRMMALFGAAPADLGFADRNIRIGYVIGVIGRTVASTNDLTDDEVKTVCEALEAS